MSTHLANERTLLAWLRTTAAFLSIGLAFAKVGHTILAPLQLPV
jgi:uncharacterized membrane protein YidH (DUF202 family)